MNLYYCIWIGILNFSISLLLVYIELEDNDKYSSVSFYCFVAGLSGIILCATMCFYYKYYYIALQDYETRRQSEELIV